MKEKTETLQSRCPTLKIISVTGLFEFQSIPIKITPKLKLKVWISGTLP